MQKEIPRLPAEAHPFRLERNTPSAFGIHPFPFHAKGNKKGCRTFMVRRGVPWAAEV
jgi:hypothetical protein